MVGISTNKRWLSRRGLKFFVKDGLRMTTLRTGDRRSSIIRMDKSKPKPDFIRVPPLRNQGGAPRAVALAKNLITYSDISTENIRHICSYDIKINRLKEAILPKKTKGYWFINYDIIGFELESDRTWYIMNYEIK